MYIKKKSSDHANIILLVSIRNGKCSTIKAKFF